MTILYIIMYLIMFNFTCIGSFVAFHQSIYRVDDGSVEPTVTLSNPLPNNLTIYIVIAAHGELYIASIIIISCFSDIL